VRFVGAMGSDSFVRIDILTQWSGVGTRAIAKAVGRWMDEGVSGSSEASGPPPLAKVRRSQRLRL